ncbi:class I SAM-dependent methyltransferase, partial [bacterium]
MAQYEKLAEIYDYLVAGVDYDDWLDYIEEILDRYDYRTRTVIDLACGTGNTTLPFARRGYT